MRIKSRESVMERHRFSTKRKGRGGGHNEKQQQLSRRQRAVVSSCKSCARSNKLRRSCDDLQNFSAKRCRLSFYANERLVRHKSASLKACRFYILHNSVDRHCTTMLILISNRERLLSTFIVDYRAEPLLASIRNVPTV